MDRSVLSNSPGGVGAEPSSARERSLTARANAMSACAENGTPEASSAVRAGHRSCAAVGRARQRERNFLLTAEASPSDTRRLTAMTARDASVSFTQPWMLRARSFSHAPRVQRRLTTSSLTFTKP